MYCRFCGKEINNSDNFCVHCGKPVSNGQNTAETQQTHTDNMNNCSEPDGVAAELIGKNKEYYIPAFQKLKGSGKYISWNWPAFLAGPYWMVYRKLYIWAAGFILLSLLLMVEGAGILLHVLSGIFGNYIYMKRVEELTAQAKILPLSEQEQFVRQKGGVNIIAVIALVVLWLVFIALIISLIIAFMNTSTFNSFNYYWWD